MAIAVLLEAPSGTGWLQALTRLFSHMVFQPGEDAEAKRPALSAQDEDNALVTRARGGDRRAFEQLVRRHYDMIHRVAWRQCGNRADAEDIAQTVLMRLVEKLDSWRMEGRFTTWLIGITINACRDHHRRQFGFARMREALGFLTSRSEASARDADPYRRHWLASILAKLDPKLRATLVLVAGEGLSHAEAARQLGVSENTISWRMSKVRDHLVKAGENHHA